MGIEEVTTRVVKSKGILGIWKSAIQESEIVQEHPSEIAHLLKKQENETSNNNLSVSCGTYGSCSERVHGVGICVSSCLPVSQRVPSLCVMFTLSHFLFEGRFLKSDHGCRITKTHSKCFTFWLFLAEITRVWYQPLLVKK